uniref:Uncharacterized protein n=1 Tax=Rhizophora mucronata TaxID=61149 RepID=A0A2P2J5V1_RHIMU
MEEGTIGFVSDVPNLTGEVHLLPCAIKYDGPSAVSHYFKPKPTGIEVDGLTMEEAYFRGRKLDGVTLPLPPTYSGIVPVFFTSFSFFPFCFSPTLVCN